MWSAYYKEDTFGIIEKEITNYTRTNSPQLLLGDFNARTNWYPDYTIIDIDSEIINIEGDMLDLFNDIHKLESYSVPIARNS